MVKIAHCTDFSKNSEKALEAILFNFWSFDITIDIIHLVEGDYAKAAARLEAYKKELISSHGTRVAFKVYLFETSEKEALISQLNSEGYYATIAGLEGIGETAGIGSFLEELYKSYLGNMTIVPFWHEIKIENKVLVAVEYENIEEFYAIVQVKNFLDFQFSKLTVLVRVKEDIAQVQVLEIEAFLRKVLPSLEIELLVYNPEICTNFITKGIKEKQLDYYIIFKGDYFDSCIYNMIVNKPAGNTFKERVVRMSTAPEDIHKLKSGDNPLNQINLKLE
ncbi:hypothetical protein [Arcticibacterium luteifluviistationis]|uniref:UspA domain-containing protein n=1 Tax=Arcticibacterium luteifluviistationis TaxID=1784714 RepID=A0A2Z4G873_9BACT|nr:hypothetical protein [Arcticibacterium luteifluviistationis]AWV97367.1 hypothetical protein DJ013_03945 [Arcticibacterium luteifluviistationis]